MEGPQSMKVLTLSDTHLGSQSDQTAGWGAFTCAAHYARGKEPPDVVLHLGDIVEPGGPVSLAEGLRALTAIPARRHLWVAGNNDVEALGPCGFDYPDILQEIASQHKVDLLDHHPVELDGVQFVGNMGFFDLSLWRPGTDPNYPQTIDVLRRHLDSWCQDTFGVRVDQMFNFCQKKLRQDLRSGRSRSKVLGTHMVPTSKMLLYGHSGHYDFKNAGMGWEDNGTTSHPELKLWVCGHDHRDYHDPEYPHIYNVSGKTQATHPHVFDV